KRGKPDPEAFLMAAERLGVTPGECLVFEDTDMGIEAATAAGMASVEVAPPWGRGAGKVGLVRFDGSVIERSGQGRDPSTTPRLALLVATSLRMTTQVS